MRSCRTNRAKAGKAFDVLHQPPHPDADTPSLIKQLAFFITPFAIWGPPELPYLDLPWVMWLHTYGLSQSPNAVLLPYVPSDSFGWVTSTCLDNPTEKYPVRQVGGISDTVTYGWGPRMFGNPKHHLGILYLTKGWPVHRDCCLLHCSLEVIFAEDGGYVLKILWTFFIIPLLYVYHRTAESIDIFL